MYNLLYYIRIYYITFYYINSNLTSNSIIPCEASTAEGQYFLTSKHNDHICFTDKRLQQREFLFEANSNWLSHLAETFIHLGSQLNSPEGSFAFPLSNLLEEFEEISATLAMAKSPISRGWSVECMRRVGVSYGIAIECLIALTDKWSAKAPRKLIHMLSNISYSLVSWKKLASIRMHSSSRGEEVEEMFQIVKSGVLRIWLERIRSHLGTLSGIGAASSSSSSIGGRMMIIDEFAVVDTEIKQMKSYVDELTLG